MNQLEIPQPVDSPEEAVNDLCNEERRGLTAKFIPEEAVNDLCNEERRGLTAKFIKEFSWGKHL